MQACNLSLASQAALSKKIASEIELAPRYLAAYSVDAVDLFTWFTLMTMFTLFILLELLYTA